MSSYPKSITDKIKTPESLVNILREKNGKKIAMCHGVFDIVHPGHIRHLIYAKQQGEILIASCTADKHIEKGEDKPYIPEELRARNLAALEMVDYVMIDHNKTPIENLLLIRPDVFIKGFEYTKDGIHPKTKTEIDAVSSYGGRVIFSPGDYVQSSSNWLTIKRPKISFEKVLSIIDSENVLLEDILQTLSTFDGIRVHVFGDTIVDRYIFCSVLGPTTKTPTLSIKRESEETYLGAAGVVSKHLKSLGADVTFTTVMGSDSAREFAENDLDQWGIKTNILTDSSRPTTIKERFWANGYKLLQVDDLDNSPISGDIERQLVGILKDTVTDVVIFSDFRHGIFHSGTVSNYTSAIPKAAVKIADTQVSNRWGNILDFQNFDIITPNEHEARFALADQDSGVRPLGSDLFAAANSKNLILKLGERGIMVFRDDSSNPRNSFAIESFVEDLVDGVGAGDSLLAAATLSYTSTRNIVVSSIIGNAAAAVACETEGNVPISSIDIENLLNRMSVSNFV